MDAAQDEVDKAQEELDGLTAGSSDYSAVSKPMTPGNRRRRLADAEKARSTAMLTYGTNYQFVVDEPLR